MRWSAPIRYQGSACELTFTTPVQGVVLLTIAGHDIGEFGALPMSQLERYFIDDRPIALFIDARSTKGASMEVSGAWAQWLAEHRDHLAAIHMLVSSRLVHITAKFVRDFSGLDDLMRVYTDTAAFDAALREFNET